MRCFVLTENGYIFAIGTGNGGAEIPEAEYNTVLDVIRNRPKATGTMDFHLREDLTWEEYELEPPDSDPDVNDAELLNILMGVSE